MRATIRTIWAIAKSPQLQMSDEELHLLLSAQTGKNSLRHLSQHELDAMAAVLGRMKKELEREGSGQKRRRGNLCTVNQRKKIYRLTETLGWDKPSRLSGMCRRMFGVERVEWLTYQQCSKLIEALKKMAEREPERRECDAVESVH